MLILPGTQLYKYGTRFLKKHRRLVRRFESIALEYSRLFLQQVVPRGTILRHVYVEYYDSRLGITFARQAGSYPIVVEIPCKIEAPKIINIYVYSHSARSVRGLPIPLNPNTTSLTIISRIVGEKTAQRIAAQRPFKSDKDLRALLGNTAEELFSIRGHSCRVP